MFDYWVILEEARPDIEEYCGDWLRSRLKGYTGCVNFETIGAKIIEAHLRFADQWPDLYGPGWIEAVVDLYASGRWDFCDDARRTGYSIVLFGAHGTRYAKPDQGTMNEFLSWQGISSMQMTFHDDRPPEMHSMPPGGFRLAIINCWNPETGFEVRERLALLFRLPTSVGQLLEFENRSQNLVNNLIAVSYGASRMSADKNLQQLLCNFLSSNSRPSPKKISD
jgi:hypothetical protein